jgi:two-component system phosphate regulon sensor histidine kinase PhoR
MGLIRCNNKDLSRQRYNGRFIKEDLELLQRIGEVIAESLTKLQWVKRQRSNLEGQLHGMHHELLSPVDGLIVQAEWLQDVFLTKPNSVDRNLLDWRLQDIVEGARQVESVVKNVGTLEQEDVSLTIEEIDLPNLLYICRGWLRGYARQKRVNLDIEHLSGARVYGDKNLILRVLYNVLQNAIKYSAPTGLGKYVRVTRVPGARVTLDIEDNGIGVHPSDAKRIFVRGERGLNVEKYAPSGAGLGLAYCDRICRAHGGSISLVSLSDPTIFRLCLEGAK